MRRISSSNFVSMPHKFWMSILGSKLECRRISYWPGVTEWSQTQAINNNSCFLGGELCHAWMMGILVTFTLLAQVWRVFGNLIDRYCSCLSCLQRACQPGSLFHLFLTWSFSKKNTTVLMNQCKSMQKQALAWWTPTSTILYSHWI